MTKREAAVALVEMCCVLSKEYKDEAEYHEAVAIACSVLIDENIDVRVDYMPLPEPPKEVE